MAQNASPHWPDMPVAVRIAYSEIVTAKDNRGLPFAIVDKKLALVFVFNGVGHLQGAAPALLGLAPGDAELAAPTGVDTHTLSSERRTTPAGRFLSEPGRNLSGEAIVWVDYTARLAIHRLRPAAPSERRPERLASSTPDDNRITLGCVVVEPLFYDRVVAPTLGRGYGVVYVLPEILMPNILMSKTSLAKPVLLETMLPKTVAATNPRANLTSTISSTERLQATTHEVTAH